MAVYRWSAGVFSGVAEFEPDEKDVAAFGQLLKREVRSPVRLMVDIIEEDFRTDTMPNVYGRDREALKQRTLQKHFRQYPHSRLTLQGREEQGRRDNIVLLSALTNHQLLKPWLNMLAVCKIPLEGIYTLPLVGESLLKYFNAQNKRVLLISQQVPSNVRQSFYDDGRLKLSRLAPGRDDYSSHYEVLYEETDRTIKFLENQHYLGTDDILEVYYICHHDERQHLSQVLKDSVNRHYHIVDKDELAQAVGIKSPTPSKYCSWIYTHVLLSSRNQKPHYATQEDRWYYFHYHANRFMVAISLLLLLISLSLGAASFINAYVHGSQISRLQQDTARYNDLYHNVIAEISDSRLDVGDVRDTVDLVNDIQEKYAQLPFDMMQLLSQQLGKYPDINLQELKWASTYDEEHSFGESKALTVGNKRSRALKKRKRRVGQQTLYEKALIKGRVDDFDGNPRIAVERVQAFVESMKQSENIKTIEIIKMPFDIASDSSFTGRGINSGQWNNTKEAEFILIAIKETQP